MTYHDPDWNDITKRILLNACVISAVLLCWFLWNLSWETRARTALWEGLPAKLDLSAILKPAVDQITAAGKHINEVAVQTGPDQIAMIETTNELAKLSYDFMFDLHAGILGGGDSHGKEQAGVLPLLAVDLQNLNQATLSLTAAIDGISGDAHSVLAPLKDAMVNVSAATDQVNVQLSTIGPHAVSAVDALQKAIEDANKVIQDPNIQKTLAHIENSTETVAIAIEPWRKRANRALSILKFIAGRFTFPIP
jgi:hypothetical protein